MLRSSRQVLSFAEIDVHLFLKRLHAVLPVLLPGAATAKKTALAGGQDAVCILNKKI
jgi:hypothetical protein